MLIGIHDAEQEHFKTSDKFPNYALMKISAWHKAKGDEVAWWNPMLDCDKVYSSKVFDFTPENLYLPEDAVRGGTGYGIYDELPPEIDAMFPDYSIYPQCDFAVGYLTRGCINKCRWCTVPRKEGYIRAYRRWEKVVRPDTDKLVLMDNNVLACSWGTQQLKEISRTGYKVDLNQGMDARLVTPEIADILARVKWIKYIRFSCDTKAQIIPVQRAARLLMERGVPASRLFVYCLITKDVDDDLDRIYALRRLGAITVYAQPEKNPTQNIMPEHWQNVMAQKWVYAGSWRKESWWNYIRARPFLNVQAEDCYKNQ